MSTQVSEQQTATSILGFVSTGAYPQSDDVASRELSAAALPVILEVVGNAEEDLKSEIRKLSSHSAPDIDGWIVQAKRLQADIERSKATAREIVQEAEAGKALKAHAGDAANKVDLLRKELDFNETLAGTLETLQVVAGLLDSVQNAMGEDERDLSKSLGKLEEAQRTLGGLDGFKNMRFAGLLEKRTGQIKERLVEEILGCWNSLVVVDTDQQSITVLQEKEGTPLSLSSTVDAMSKLDILSISINRLHRDLHSLIIGPRMIVGVDGTNPRLAVSEKHIQLSRTLNKTTALDVIEDVYGIVNFLGRILPEMVSVQLLDMILPSLILQLISGWLDPSLPLDLDQLGAFGDVMAKISDLAQFISGTRVTMPSEADLTTWIRRIPQTWLARKKEALLMAMRTKCYEAVKIKKTVERVETQVVSSDDLIVAGQQSQPQDDWDLGWGNDEEDDATELKDPIKLPEEEEDVDASAWDLEEPEETIPQELEESKGDSEEDDVEAEAWGWGEDNVETEDSAPVVDSKTKPTTKANGSAKQQAPQTHEITLRETYTVTSIPDVILKLLQQILQDASTLSSPDFAVSSISAARAGLSSIPTLLLAMYRATSTFYSTDPAGNVLIYNDTQHLLSELNNVLSSIPEDHPLSKRLRLDADIQQLGVFARRAYGREMDSQRTILSDLLSSTSGFINCTAPLNEQQYRATVKDATDRVRDVDRVWTSVLSDSARLQSLGSLVGTLVHKMIADILELADEPAGISEEQSKILKGFCDDIASLADLFTDPHAKAAASLNPGETTSLVHVYTPDWLRFIYLGEILEASLADIRYLWTKSELALEFEAAEVVDLVQALFADSSHRKDAIREIKSTGST